MIIIFILCFVVSMASGRHAAIAVFQLSRSGMNESDLSFSLSSALHRLTFDYQYYFHFLQSN